MTAPEKVFLAAFGGLLAVCSYDLLAGFLRLEWNLWNEYRRRRRQKEAK